MRINCDPARVGVWIEQIERRDVAAAAGWHDMAPHGTRRAAYRCAAHTAGAATVKVAAPATLLTHRPTPEDSSAQPPALGAIPRGEGAGGADLRGGGALRRRKPRLTQGWARHQRASRSALRLPLR